MLKRAAVLLALLSGFSLHAALGPAAEIAVTPPAYGPMTPGHHDTVAIATDGSDFLTIWRDHTPGREGFYATIVSENGATRPIAPLLVHDDVVSGVGAVWTGNRYLVTVSPYLKTPFVMNLDRDAQIVSPPRTIDLGGDAGIQALAWNGHRVLAITSGTEGQGAALLDADGDVMKSDIVLPSGVRYPAVDAAGEAFIVVWPEELPLTGEGQKIPFRRVRAARISAEGDVSEPLELLPPALNYPLVRTATNGTEVGVVVELSTSIGGIVHRFTIDASLAVDAEEPFTLPQYTYSNVDVAATSRGFVAAYLIADGTELKTVAFGSTTTGTIPLPERIGWPLQVEANGRSVMAVWGSYTARASVFDAALAQPKTGIFAVAVGPLRQDGPLIASAGDHGVVAWNESGTLKLRRLGRDGLLVDAQPMIVATNAGRAAIVFTGRVWMIVWHDATAGIATPGMKMRRMSPEGIFLGEPESLEGLTTHYLAIATNGSTVAMVTSIDLYRGGLVLTRFSADGERLDATPIVLTNERSSDHPAIASNGDGFLVVWSWSFGYTPHVYGKFLDSAGNPIGAEPIAIANGSEFSHSNAKVASDGENYLVVYTQASVFEIRDPPSPYDPRPIRQRVRTKRVLANGSLADTTADQEGTYIALGTNPEILHDGRRFLLTFTREVTDQMWLQAAELDASGRPMDVARQIVRARSYEPQHSVAAIGGAIWTTYSRTVTELSNVQRAFLREVTEDAARRRGARK